ncbi:hypothetical protein CPAR01_15560 [Colletotrichum paranaense]|uniref:Uncharacterized protein n=2 Tax=Colletotrichum acutatum species complex TaxID=2707335 RepID=A0AAI9UJ67_9PEZI|nr:uncharacterized protein CPAR01_15560 [Colletotrichum paranaense]KAK1459409.1 hypothetical protein CMEL01_02408 [Colletotrichum melonis]KAK1519122.1 hypothetical protein CPAR01_15560 [Colletotrichum paranaense]
MLRCLSTLRQALKPVQESVLATSHPWPPRRIKPVCTRIHDHDHRREEGSHATGPPSSDLDTCALHLLLRTYRASAIPQQSCKVPLAPPKRHTLSSLPHCQPLLDTAMQSQIIRGKRSWISKARHACWRTAADGTSLRVKDQTIRLDSSSPPSLFFLCLAMRGGLGTILETRT